MIDLGIDQAKDVALQVLEAVESKGSYVNLALKSALGRLDKRDRSLATEIVYGTVRRRGTLDYILSKFVSRPLEKTDSLTRNILRMGLYQAKFMDLHEAIAVHESVELAKRCGRKGAAPFINAVLRSILRANWESLFPGPEEGPLYLAVRYSHPLWLVERWIRYLGFEETERLCQADNAVPPTTVRTNLLKISPEGLSQSLEQMGVEVTPGRHFAEAFHIRDYPSIESLPQFKEGLFVVQDESSMTVSHLLDPQPGETVCDLCAAPGGKTSHISALMKNEGTVLAVDPHSHKIKMMKQTFLRLGVKNAVTFLGDARELPPEMEGKADRVLLDAPCSGLGVLRRKPDIRWRKDPEDVLKLVHLQRELLAGAVRCLRSGGRLVYSTCTLAPEENEENVKWLVAEKPEMKLLDPLSLPKVPGSLAENATRVKEGILLLPQNTGTDGFFAAVFTKV